MNKNDVVVDGMRSLGLSKPEALVYAYLLSHPATHAQISVATGINRTTVYRLIKALQRRGLVVQCFDDRGKYLTAADPATFEAEIVMQESRAIQQRAAYTRLLPMLEEMKKGYEVDFAIHTYEGAEGFKRMLWHELKTEGECLCLGYGTLEDIVPDHHWTERHRQLTVGAGYRIREISNFELEKDDFTDVEFFLDNYQLRIIDAELMPIHHLTTIYNDTVAIYNVREGSRIGLEIVSHHYAESMRGMFELLWSMAGTAPGK